MNSKQCSAVLLVLAAAALPLGCGDDNDSSESTGADAGRSSSDAGMPGTGDGGASGAGSSEGASGGTSNGGSPDGDAGAASGGAPSTPPDDCMEYATAWCSGLSECAPMRIIRDYEDEDNCVAVIGTRCATERERGFPIADLAGCTETLSQGDCQEILSDVSGACRHEHGTKAGGEPCIDLGECESGICRYSGTQCGECLDLVPVGAPCSGDGVSCLYPEQVCDFDNDECAEIRFLDVGETCNLTMVEQCRPDLVCSEGECKETLGEGADCSLEPSRCDLRRWLTCVDNECVPFDVKNLGESCGSEWPFPRCSDYAYCDPDALECVPRRGIDEDCEDDPVAGSTCLVGLSCVDGKCVNLTADCLD